MDDSRIRTFGPFQLDLNTGQLRRAGVTVPLQRQPARVLVTLVSQAPDLVSRDDLRATVWDEETHVDFDRGLNYCIRYLRAALGDDARQPQFVETVARQGYRFIAPVGSVRTRRHPNRRWRRLGSAVAAATVIALVTFAVEGGSRNEQHHAAALAVARLVHDFIF